MTAKFQSTLSVRRATAGRLCLEPHRLISIHALRKESDPVASAVREPAVSISIHALRKESDVVGVLVGRVIDDFNPRSP